ncbi:unnamed protein product [Closterium sp. NIES-53]
MSVSKMAGLSQSLHTPPRSPAGPFVANPRVVSSSASLSRGVTRLAVRPASRSLLSFPPTPALLLSSTSLLSFPPLLPFSPSLLYFP